MHWYQNDKPRYEATMRTARKEGLLPSVTSIDGVIANYGLELYKLRHMFEAAQETIDFAEAKRKAQKHSRDAAKLGTVIHHLIERYLSGKPLFFVGSRDDVWRIFDEARKWIDDNIDEVLAVEKVFVGEDYAGKADCVCVLKNDRTVIIDWKSTDPAGKLKKDGQPGKGKMFYPSHIRQLSALKFANKEYQVEAVMNVVISTNPNIPGVWAKEWTGREVYKGWGEFTLAKALWYSVNDMEPVK